MAAFNEGDLIRVVYTGTGGGTEYATDLGAFSATSALTSNYALNTDTFSLASIGATSWADVKVAYFVMSSTGAAGNGAAYTSGTATGGNINTYAFWGSYQPNAGSTMDTYHAAAGTSNNATVSQSSTYSYWNMMNGGGTTIGTMNQYLASGDAEKTLTALGSSSYVDQVLYYYGSDPDSGVKGTQVATIRTFADGHTEAVAVANTPIPAAVYLFGSGLMGLVGLRRKMSA